MNCGANSFSISEEPISVSLEQVAIRISRSPSMVLDVRIGATWYDVDVSVNQYRSITCCNWSHNTSLPHYGKDILNCKHSHRRIR